VNTVPVEGQPVRLRSERLLLRDLQSGDWRAVCALRGDADVARGLGLEPDGEAESGDWLERAIHHNRLLPREAYNLAVVVQESGDVAGWIGMNRLDSAAGEVEYELSFALMRRYWGRGYMTEALKRLALFAFSVLHARRLVADCLPHNAASVRVLQKVGMHYEGRVPVGDATDTCLRYVLDVQAWQSQRAAD